MATEERWYPVIPGRSNNPDHYIAIGNANARKRLKDKWVLSQPATTQSYERYLYRVYNSFTKNGGRYFPALGRKLYEVEPQCIFNTEEEALAFRLEHELTSQYWGNDLVKPIQI